MISLFWSLFKAHCQRWGWERRWTEKSSLYPTTVWYNLCGTADTTPIRQDKTPEILKLPLLRSEKDIDQLEGITLGDLSMWSQDWAQSLPHLRCQSHRFILMRHNCYTSTSVGSLGLALGCHSLIHMQLFIVCALLLLFSKCSGGLKIQSQTQQALSTRKKSNSMNH